jgi:hypothetical protein
MYSVTLLILYIYHNDYALVPTSNYDGKNQGRDSKILWYNLLVTGYGSHSRKQKL